MFFQAHFLRQSHLSPKQPFFVSQGTRGGEGLSDDTTTAVLETTIQVIITSNRKSHSKFYGLRRQPLVSPRNDVRNKHRNSTLMTPSCFWLVVWREKCIPKICFHQSDTLPRYRGETSGDVARCWLFFQAKDSTITRIFLYLFRPICTILNTTSLLRARPKMSQAWPPRYL